MALSEGAGDDRSKSAEAEERGLKTDEAEERGSKRTGEAETGRKSGGPRAPRGLNGTQVVCFVRNDSPVAVSVRLEVDELHLATGVRTEQFRSGWMDMPSGPGQVRWIGPLDGAAGGAFPLQNSRRGEAVVIVTTVRREDAGLRGDDHGSTLSADPRRGYANDNRTTLSRGHNQQQLPSASPTISNSPADKRTQSAQHRTYEFVHNILAFVRPRSLHVLPPDLHLQLVLDLDPQPECRRERHRVISAGGISGVIARRVPSVCVLVSTRAVALWVVLTVSQNGYFSDNGFAVYDRAAGASFQRAVLFFATSNSFLDSFDPHRFRRTLRAESFYRDGGGRSEVAQVTISLEDDNLLKGTRRVGEEVVVV